MTSKEIEQKIAEAFNKHFPGGVTGNLPGYEKDLLALIQQARVDTIQEVINAVEPNQQGQFEEHGGNVAWYLDELIDRITEIKGETK